MINKIKVTHLNKDRRSQEIKINTILNFFFRGLSIFCSFLIVPVALSYIDKVDYGVWLTLTSITAWLSYMDIGLGNGLRNKLGEAIAQNNETLANEYVSTTYFIFGIVITGIFVVFSLINPFINWNSILKTNISHHTLLFTTYFIVGSFCVRLILDLAGIVIISLQKPYIKTLIDFTISFVTLISIFLISHTASPSFGLFSSAVAAVPVIVLLGFNYILFWKSKYRYLKPTIKHVKRNNMKGLLSVGGQFFVIQFVGIIIFSTDNILITQFYSPTYVTSFNIAYKYFTIATISFSIILLPYWSAFTNAYVKNDNEWIGNAFKKLLKLFVVQIIGVIVLIIGANIVYKSWVGSSVDIPFSLSLWLGVYSIIVNWNNMFAYFINGVSKIRLQLYSSIIIGVINIPLSYVLAKYTGWGLCSIVIANTLCLFVSAVWSPIQCYKIINNKATGIWNK
jgi:O-antigen/teichoic acid export membrane protein